MSNSGNVVYIVSGNLTVCDVGTFIEDSGYTHDNDFPQLYQITTGYPSFLTLKSRECNTTRSPKIPGFWLFL